MRQLKFLAITMMYIFIFVYFLSERNIAAELMLVFLFINYICLRKCINKSNESLKRQLAKQREFFISYLNHDLRIPTIAQIRALELLKDEKLGGLSCSEKEMVIQIEQSCKYVLNLISLMINTYNMENNTYKLIYERFNISEIIISCFDELLPMAKEKRITFEYNGKNKDINITADKSELKKVIVNALSALISKSYEGETVSVIISAFHNRVKLTMVCDNKNTSYLNSKFTSVGENIRMGFCKKIIETHNGRVLKDNVSNSFSFELPVAANI